MRVGPVARVAAAAVAAALGAMFVSAVVLGVFILAEGDGGEPPELTAAWLLALAAFVLVTAALSVALGWLARTAATGVAIRPGWRFALACPLALGAVLATVFVRP